MAFQAQIIACQTCLSHGHLYMRLARASQHTSPAFMCHHHPRLCYRCGLVNKDETVATDIVDTGLPRAGDLWAHASCRPMCSKDKCTRPGQCLDNDNAERPWCRDHLKCTHPSIIKPSGVCGRMATIRITMLARFLHGHHEPRPRELYVCCDAHDKATTRTLTDVCIATKIIKGKTARCSLPISPVLSTDGLCVYHRKKQAWQVKTMCAAFDKLNIGFEQNVLSTLPPEVLVVIFSYCDSAMLHKLYNQNRELRKEIQAYDQLMVKLHCTVALKPMPLRHYDDSMRGQRVTISVAVNGLWCIHDEAARAAQIARHRRANRRRITLLMA